MVDVAKVQVDIQILGATRSNAIVVTAADVTPNFGAFRGAQVRASGFLRAVTGVAADGNIRVWAHSSTTLRVAVSGWLPAAPPVVQLPRLSSPSRSSATSYDAAVARQILQNTNRYTVSTWRQEVLPSRIASLRRNQTQPGVIAIAAEADALAASIRTDAYDQHRAGLSVAAATTFARHLIDIVSSQHLANHPGGWGQPWLRGPCRPCEFQQGLCAALTARAAWFLWGALTLDERTAVTRMLEYEADRELQVPLHYLRDRAGHILTPGNSGADELAWEASAPALAAAMFPTAAHRPAWIFKVVQLTVAAWSRPQDVTSPSPISGAALSRWLDGSNMEPDGEMLNHHRLAPDYLGEIDHTITAIRDLTLAGQTVPDSLLHNIGPIYLSLTQANHPSPPYLAPGGTVYRPGSSAIYWPMRSDWGERQPITFAVIDAEAAALGFGGTDAAEFARLHMRDALSMQTRSTDRRSYLSRREFSKATAEEQTAWLAADLYLTETVHASTSWDHSVIWSNAFNNEYRGRDTLAQASRYVR